MISTHLRCLQRFSAQYVGDPIAQAEYSGPRGHRRQGFGLAASWVRRMAGSGEHEAKLFRIREHELTEMKEG